MKPKLSVLVADDDPEDCMLVKDAWDECNLSNDLRFVNDGEELLHYLLHQGKYANAADSPEPHLILLDLNMPRKSGHEALKEIKSHPNLRRIPVVVLTTSSAEEDICRTYELGVNGFITKPLTFDGLIKVIKTVDEYWFDVVKLPGRGRASDE